MANEYVKCFFLKLDWQLIISNHIPRHLFQRYENPNSHKKLCTFVLQIFVHLFVMVKNQKKKTQCV